MAKSGQGLIGWVKAGGTVDDTLRAVYVEVAKSPQFAQTVARYNKLARFLQLRPSASVDEIVKVLGDDVTFSRIGNVRTGMFVPGQHPGNTTYWIQGNPTTVYGARAGRHELVHLGAALRGQGDTFLHEVAVQLVTTPENLVGITCGIVVVIGGEAYWLSSE